MILLVRQSLICISGSRIRSQILKSLYWYLKSSVLCVCMSKLSSTVFIFRKFSLNKEVYLCTGNADYPPSWYFKFPIYPQTSLDFTGCMIQYRTDQRSQQRDMNLLKSTFVYCTSTRGRFSRRPLSFKILKTRWITF